MGIEYYAVNHTNKTFFELGKGCWYELNNTPLIMYEPTLLSEFLSETCGYDLDPELIKYYNLVGIELFKFVRGTPINRVVIINDCGDDVYYMRCLDYKCVGSRYYLGDEKENLKSVEFENRHLNNRQTGLYGYCKLGEKELNQLKAAGWNVD